MTRPRLTYANVMATIAVFIALGGVGYAASKIKGTEIKKNSIPVNRLVKDAQDADKLLVAGEKRKGKRGLLTPLQAAAPGSESSLVTMTATPDPQPQLLFEKTPLTFSATCVDLGNNARRVEVLVTSSEDGWQTPAGTHAAGEAVALYTFTASDTSTPLLPGKTVISPSGTAVSVDPPMMRVNTFGADCALSVHAIG